MTTHTTQATVHSTFAIEHSYPQAPSRVFAAFAEPARKRAWYVEGGQEVEEFEMDFRVGGSERFRYRFKEGHPIAGSEIANEGRYQDIVSDARIVLSSKMALNGKPIVIALATLEFVPAGAGTDLILTHQGVFLDWAEGPEMLKVGWQTLFSRLETSLAQPAVK